MCLGTDVQKYCTLGTIVFLNMSVHSSEIVFNEKKKK